MIFELHPKFRNSATAEKIFAGAYAEAFAQARAEGILAGIAKCLKRVIAKRFGAVPDEVLNAIDTLDEATLLGLHDLALDSQSEKEFSEGVMRRAIPTPQD